METLILASSAAFVNLIIFKNYLIPVVYYLLAVVAAVVFVSSLIYACKLGRREDAIKNLLLNNQASQVENVQILGADSPKAKKKD